VWKQKHYAVRYQIQSREGEGVILADGMYSAVDVSLPYLGGVSVMIHAVDFGDDLYRDVGFATILVVDFGEFLSFGSPLLLWLERVPFSYKPKQSVL